MAVYVYIHWNVNFMLTLDQNLTFTALDFLNKSLLPYCGNCIPDHSSSQTQTTEVMYIMTFRCLPPHVGCHRTCLILWGTVCLLLFKTVGGVSGSHFHRAGYWVCMDPWPHWYWTICIIVVCTPVSTTIVQ